jgi:hypothetical protein
MGIVHPSSLPEINDLLNKLSKYCSNYLNQICGSDPAPKSSAPRTTASNIPF